MSQVRQVTQVSQVTQDNQVSQVTQTHQETQVIQPTQADQVNQAGQVTGKKRISEASVTTMLDELGWRGLKQRRADQRLIMLYKIVNNLVEVDLSKELIPLTRHFRNSHAKQIL